MPSASSRILSRLRTKTAALTASSTPRRLSTFHITLADPHRAYAPESLVAGSVHITVDRPLPITHLTVALVGRVSLDGEEGEVFARDEIVLTGEGRLETGRYEFMFEVEVRSVWGTGGLPSSIDVFGFPPFTRSAR